MYDAIHLKQEQESFGKNDLEILRQGFETLDLTKFVHLRQCITTLLKVLEILKVSDNLDLFKEDSQDVNGDLTMRQLNNTEKKIFRDLLNELKILDELVRKPEGIF